MKKKLCLAITTITLAICNAFSACAEQTPTVTYMGEEVVTPVAPVISDGRIMLPFRAVFEALGATVDFDAEEKSFTAEKDDIRLKMTVGSNELIVQSGFTTQAYRIDAPPVIVNDRVLAPLRYAAQIMGYDVNWDAENKVADIVQKAEEVTQKQTKTSVETTTEATTKTTTETTKKAVTTEAATETTTQIVIGKTSHKNLLKHFGSSSGSFNFYEKTNEVVREAFNGSIVYHTDMQKSTYSSGKVELPVTIKGTYHCYFGTLKDNKITFSYNYYDVDNHYLGTGTFDVENLEPEVETEFEESIYLDKRTQYVYWHLANYRK